MRWRGHTKGSGHPMHWVGINPKITAWCQPDLQSHVTFIRRSLADGKNFEEIGRAIGVNGQRVRNFARKLEMKIVRKRSVHFSQEDAVDQSSFRPRKKQAVSP